MKNHYKLSVLVLSLLLLTSCSIEDLVKEEPSQADILIAQSPWEFESFQLLQIVKKENDTITDQWVEKIVNETYENLAFTFKEDGIGYTTLPDEEPFAWTWFFNGENKICFDDVCDEESFTKIKLTDNTFQFENISASPEDANGNSTLYIGRYFFK